MEAVREGLKLVVNSSAWRRMGAWARGAESRRRPPAAQHELDGVAVPAEVIVYFGDTEAKAYQIRQWLPVLERLHETHSVLLVFRRLGAMRALREETRLPKIFVRNFAALMDLFGENAYKLALYVNNGVSNFQALNSAAMLHVHVNHGESDKVSMVSNQVKAYDKVFVAGPAAIDRHRRVLFDFDESKLAVVGRPQLDFEFPPELERFPDLRTVMYAPTWEGENDANNYTSVDCFGVQIVMGLLSLPDVRVIYRPHPRVARSSDPAVRQAHDQIVAMIEARSLSDERPHVVSLSGNILAMLPQVDAMITDVSSVGLDFLYVHPEKPLVLTDRRTDRTALEEASPLAKGVSVIDANNVWNTNSIINNIFDNDVFEAGRQQIRRYYFGEFQHGESTEKFIGTISELIEGRARAIRRRLD